MQKRKLKLNILDILIVIVIICSAAVLMFRDTVDELFSEPEMNAVLVTVYVDGEEAVSAAYSALNKAVLFELQGENDIASEGTVTSVEVVHGSLTVPKQAKVTVSVVGYTKLGRYYTESGERIYIDDDCTFAFGEARVEGTVIAVAKKG